MFRFIIRLLLWVISICLFAAFTTSFLYKNTIVEQFIDNQTSYDLVFIDKKNRKHQISSKTKKRIYSCIIKNYYSYTDEKELFCGLKKMKLQDKKMEITKDFRKDDNWDSSYIKAFFFNRTKTCVLRLENDDIIIQ